MPLSELVLSGELARHPIWRVEVDGSDLRLRPA
jgi:hypothetical protein